MNRCTQPDDILREDVPWQLHEPYLISRSYVKGQGHFFISRPKFTKLFSSNVEKSVVDNAVFC